MFPGVQFIAGFVPSIYTFLLEVRHQTSVRLGFITLFFGSIQGVLFPICYLSNTGALSVILACIKRDTQSFKQEIVTENKDDIDDIDDIDEDMIIERDL